MKYAFLLILFTLSVESSFARCSGFSANGLFRHRYNCGSESRLDEVTNAFYNEEKYKAAFNAVDEVCKTGCSKYFMFAEKEKQACHDRYAKALDLVKFEVPSDCKDKGNYDIVSAPQSAQEKCGCKTDPISKIEVCQKCPPPDLMASLQAKKNSPDEVCEWSTRVAVDMMCGKAKKDNNICGAGGRTICSGRIVCFKPASFKDKSGKEVELNEGEYDISCLSRSGYCDDKKNGPKLSACLADDGTVHYSEESLIPFVPSSQTSGVIKK